MTRTHVRELAEEGRTGAFFSLITKLPSVRNSFMADGCFQGRCIPGEEAATQAFYGKGATVGWPAVGSSWSAITVWSCIPRNRGSLWDLRPEKNKLRWALGFGKPIRYKYELATALRI